MNYSLHLIRFNQKLRMMAEKKDTSKKDSSAGAKKAEPLKSSDKKGGSTSKPGANIKPKIK